MNFLSRLRGGKPANTTANFTFLISVLEKDGKLVNVTNLHAALLANLDYLPDGMDKSEQQRSQQEEQKAKAVEIDRILDAFTAEHPEFVRDDHNLTLLVAFVKEQHRGVFSKIAIDHFWRIYADSPDLHRLAQPVSQSEDPAVMWMKQNKVYSFEDGRRDREAATAERKKKFDSDMANAKDRATFEVEMSSIRRHRVMKSNGPSYSESVAERIARLEVLATRYPQWQSEVAAEVQRQKQTLRF